MAGPGDAVIAGVSGGVDSVCLLHILLAYRGRLISRAGEGFFIKVIHVEHGLRGADSLADARFVEALCGKLGVSCSVVQVNVSALVRAEGLSVEEAARRERYRVFAGEREKLAGSYRRVRIAVAHQMEDQAETILFHLARGTGLDGLAGMRPVRGDIIRPLLLFSRGEIEAYVLQAGGRGAQETLWRTDLTNEDTDYTRNRIRHLVLPVLTGQVNARSVEHICEAGIHIREACRFVEEQADAFIEQWVRTEPAEAFLQRQMQPGPDGGESDHAEPALSGLCSDVACIDVDALRKADPLIQSFVLRKVIAKLRGGIGLKDIGSVHIRDAQSLAFKGSGKKLDLPGGITCLRKGRKMIIFAEKGNKLSRAREEKEKRVYERKNFASDCTE